MFLTQAVTNNGFSSEIKKNSRAEYNPYEALTEENRLAKDYKAIIMNCMERWVLIIYMGS